MPPPASAWMRIGELSRRTGVSPDLLRVWERRYGLVRPRRSGGNLRLYSALDEARVRLMRRHLSARVPAAQAAELALAASLSINAGSRGSVPRPSARTVIQDLLIRLASFDEVGADQTLQHLLIEFGPTAVMRDVLLPFIDTVGRECELGVMSAAHQHFASHLIHSRLVGLARGWDRGLGPRVVLACAPDEPHTLGLICFGIAIHKLGWRVTYLGPQTPVDALTAAADQLEPSLVVVSGVLAAAFDPYAAALAGLARNHALAVAGRSADASTARRCGARLLAGDPVSAAATLTGASPRP